MASSKTAESGQLNELGQRKGDRRQENKSVASDQRKGQRRRLIDPTTCERDYTHDEIDFMQAMDEYKRKSGRMFPTCSEILEVVKGMGYRRLTAEQLANELCDDKLPPETSGDEDVLDEELLSVSEF